MRLPIVMMVLTPLLLPSSAEAASTRLERQEGCESICLQCLEQEQAEGSFCMGLYHMCCAYHKGHSYPICGCRIET